MTTFSVFFTTWFPRLSCMALCLACVAAWGDQEDEDAWFPQDRKRVSAFDHQSNHADLPPDMPRQQRRDHGMDSELEVLERFLKMPPEKLAMIRALIERIEEMPPEEKQRLRERIRQVRSMDGARQRRMLDIYRSMPWEDRMILRQYWQTLPTEEQLAIHEEMLQMTPDERLARRQELIQAAKAAGIEAPDMPPRKDNKSQRKDEKFRRPGPPDEDTGLPFLRDEGSQEE